MKSLRYSQFFCSQTQEHRVKTMTRYWLVFLVALAEFSVGVTAPAYAGGGKATQKVDPNNTVLFFLTIQRR